MLDRVDRLAEAATSIDDRLVIAKRQLRAALGSSKTPKKGSKAETCQQTVDDLESAMNPANPAN